jgi:hypothetical protein
MNIIRAGAATAVTRDRNGWLHTAMIATKRQKLLAFEGRSMDAQQPASMIRPLSDNPLKPAYPPACSTPVKATPRVFAFAVG